MPDRWPDALRSASIAAVGFGLTAYPIGVERGWVTRERGARARAAPRCASSGSAPQGPRAAGTTGYQGFFYHFLDMKTGARFETVELSTIDTALLLAGALFCQAYFDRDDAGEARDPRARRRALPRASTGPGRSRGRRCVAMGWTPEERLPRLDWRGYNEAMILYVLALGSPTHPVGPTAWERVDADATSWGDFHGQEHVGFAPLFGHQYSHVWIDFRGIQDAYMRGKGIDYFENSRRATLAQRAYAIANPAAGAGYGADVWGLTACDGPVDVDARRSTASTRRFCTYAARGAARPSSRRRRHARPDRRRRLAAVRAEIASRR